MLIRFLVVSFWLMSTYAQAAQGTDISMHFNLPEECFDQEVMNQRYADVAGVKGFYISLKLLPQCASRQLMLSVTSANNETFSGFDIPLDKTSLTHTLIFSCAMPTPIFIERGKVSTLFIMTRGESDNAEADRQVTLNFATSEPQYCEEE